jgi:hypothetical protein
MSIDKVELMKKNHDPTTQYYIEPEHFNKVSFPHVTNGYKLRNGVFLPNISTCP